jgi:hypothetical protein
MVLLGENGGTNFRVTLTESTLDFLTELHHCESLSNVHGVRLWGGATFDSHLIPLLMSMD